MTRAKALQMQRLYFRKFYIPLSNFSLSFLDFDFQEYSHVCLREGYFNSFIHDLGNCSGSGRISNLYTLNRSFHIDKHGGLTLKCPNSQIQLIPILQTGANSLIAEACKTIREIGQCPFLHFRKRIVIIHALLHKGKLMFIQHPQAAAQIETAREGVDHIHANTVV